LQQFDNLILGDGFAGIKILNVLQKFEKPTLPIKEFFDIEFRIGKKNGSN